MLKRFYRVRFMDKRAMIPLLLMLLYSFLSMVIPSLVSKPPWNETFQFFGAHYWAFANEFVVALLEIPLFLIYLLPNQELFSNNMLVMRFSSLRQYWNLRVLFTVLDAVAYACFITLCMILHFWVFGQTPSLMQNSGFVLQWLLIQFVTFTLIGIIFSLVSFCFRTIVLSFALVYGGAALDFFLSTVKNIAPILFLKGLCIDPVHSVEHYWPTLLLFTGICLAMVIVLPPLIQDRDFLSKEVI